MINALKKIILDDETLLLSENEMMEVYGGTTFSEFYISKDVKSSGEVEQISADATLCGSSGFSSSSSYDSYRPGCVFASTIGSGSGK